MAHSQSSAVQVENISHSAAFKVYKAVQPFVIGGSAGMTATVFIQPVDMIKVRMQLHGEGVMNSRPSVIRIASEIVTHEGVGAFYHGLSAALLRQATYTTARFGMHRKMTEYLEHRHKGQRVPLLEKMALGASAGGLASIVGSPADLALLRMQADFTLPVEQRRNYTGAFNALFRIVKEEGALALWRGCAPTVVRAMSLNMGLFAGNEQGKEYFGKKYGHGFWTMQFPASAIGGFLASAMALPFDFVKTRIQKQKPDANGILPYKSSLDVVVKTLKTEGPLAFYKGFFTFYFRIAPHAMMTLLLDGWLRGVARRLEEQAAEK
eukprot:CAMPEP_0196654956 /NCGR_PEP_ID=MMETSP1086-20130531/4711_1 /TAXON_ID=77921 /ORGANISM="Cyanoptyche  gloeocystis , Strain SAG4.97" /LENGTH=321 /DNA_ID=CAMNT_0041987013 /DNA_START=90 /DNA_END=1055 /DNA_ORIENTATION=+